MLHKDRVWSVKNIDSPEELVFLLTQYTWTGCSGFRIQGFLFLNDSFEEDSIQEYGVVRESDGMQVESITIWRKQESPQLLTPSDDLLECIKDIIAGRYGVAWSSGIDLSRQIQRVEEHKCYLCM